MYNLNRWNESELAGEIDSLERLLVDHKRRDPASRCAHAYLKQLLKHRQETLRALRYKLQSKRRKDSGGQVVPLHVVGSRRV